MKNLLLTCVCFQLLVTSALAQWQACAGTAGLNMQSLLSDGAFDFAGGATGAYRSLDSAASFSLSNAGNDAVGPTRFFTKDADYIYTCTSQGVFRSADHGVVWLAKSNGLTTLLSSCIARAGSMLYVVGTNGVYKSTDQGENWIAAGMSGTDVRCITAIQDTLFIGTNGSGIYKSIDQGANWVAMNNGLTSTNFRAIESKGNVLFAGGQIGTGVYRSSDFGANWTLLSGGLTSGSYRGFAHNDQLIVAGSFGTGVYYSLNDGDTWTKINTGLTDTTIFDLEFNDHYVFAATNTQGVFRFALSNIMAAPSALLEACSEKTIELFPNPSAKQFTVLLDEKDFNKSFELIDVQGRQVKSGVLTQALNLLDCGSLPSGIYMLRIGDKTSKVIFR